MKFWCAALSSGLFAMTLLAASPARADVVGLVPDSRPAGSQPSTCHGGPYCDLTLHRRRRVRPRPDLSGPRPAHCRHRLRRRRAFHREADHRHLRRGCAAGSTCVTQKVCATPSTGTGSGGNGGDGAGGNGAAGGAGGQRRRHGGDRLCATWYAATSSSGRRAACYSWPGSRLGAAPAPPLRAPWRSPAQRAEYAARSPSTPGAPCGGRAGKRARCPRAPLQDTSSI